MKLESGMTSDLNVLEPSFVFLLVEADRNFESKATENHDNPIVESKAVERHDSRTGSRGASYLQTSLETKMRDSLKYDSSVIEAYSKLGCFKLFVDYTDSAEDIVDGILSIVELHEFKSP